MTCGNSSVGRARPCQGRGREFESRFPLQIKDMRNSGCRVKKFYGALAKRLCSGLQIRLVRFDSGTRLHFLPWPDGGIGRHKGFKIPRRSRCVGSSPTPATMGKSRIIKAISSVVKPPKGGFFVPLFLHSKDASEDCFPATAYPTSSSRDMAVLAERITFGRGAGHGIPATA